MEICRAELIELLKKSAIKMKMKNMNHLMWLPNLLSDSNKSKNKKK